MKILNICVNADSYTDGLSYQDNLLPRYQKQLGNDVYLLAPEYVITNDGQYRKITKKEYIDEYGIYIKRLSIIGKHNQKYKFKRFDGFYRSIENVEPNIIFCHSIQFLDYSLVIEYMKLHPEVKLYVDSHADYENSAKSWVSKNILHKVIWRHMAQKSIPYVEVFFGVTPARVSFLQDMYQIPKNKTDLLLLGADDETVHKTQTKKTRDRVRTNLKLKDDIVMVLAGGKIDENKSEIITLMRGFVKFASDKYRLVIFGSVSEEYNTDFHNSLKSSGNRVIYVGWLNKEQIYEYFAAADLVAFPGLHSVLWEEAVGCGKPCVFRRISGFTHVDLGGNCEFFEELTDFKMWDVINRIVIERRLEQMKRVAMDEGMKQFSYQEIARRSIRDVET